MIPRRLTAITLGLALVAALPAAAEVYTIELKNGNTFDTLYKPRYADESAQKIIIATEFGNWISIPVEAIEGVTTQTETRGFGRAINTTTIMLGQAPNDAAVPGEGGEQDDPTTRLLNYLQSRDQQPPPFNVQQFVEPNSVGGMPIGFTNQTTPPIGGPATIEPPIAGGGEN